VNVLLELIGTRVSYVVQEAVVVMKVCLTTITSGSTQGAEICYNAQDIFRKYPHSYEAVIPTLCANLDELDEPEAKASLIWIIGEYAEKIENAGELLAIFVETFVEEAYQVCQSLSMFEVYSPGRLESNFIGRFSCRHSQRSLSCSSRSPTTHKESSRRCLRLPPRTARALMCGIEHTSTGDCCRRTPGQLECVPPLYDAGCINLA
jgi:vesicle coat complex subunit